MDDELNKINIPHGVGWLIGIIFCIIVIVLSTLFIEDGFFFGVIIGVCCGFSIGFSLEYGNRQKLTPEQERLIKRLIIIGIIILSIGVLLSTSIYLIM